MPKMENWSPEGEDRWVHDHYDLEAEITEEEAKDAVDADFLYVGRVYDNEVGRDVLLYRNESRTISEAREELRAFVKRSPYNRKRHVMSDPTAVDLLVRSVYTGYPWVEPDGRMPEEDGDKEFGPGETIQGHTETLGEIDWSIINRIDDKTVQAGYYTELRHHRETYVIAGEFGSTVQEFEEYAESLLEDADTEYFQWEEFRQQVKDEENLVFEETGRREQATVHETEGDMEIVETSDTAFVAEEV
jgi:hypothetical protein